MSGSSELGITELYLQSIYIEKLQASNRHSLIYDILPSPVDVVRVWIEETTQDVFVTLLNSYIMVSKEDVGSLGKIIVSLLFSPFPSISRKAFSLLSRFCDHHFRSFMRLVATNYRFSSKKIIEFYYLLIEYFLTDEVSVAKFKVPAFSLVRTLMRFRLYSEGESVEEEDMFDDDDDIMSSGESLKEVILSVFDDEYNTENWEVEDKIRCYFILSGLSMISLEFARLTMPFLMNEIFASVANIRDLCISLVFEIIFIHPCLFSETEESDKKESRKRKRFREDESEDEEEGEGEDDDEEEKEKHTHGVQLMKFMDGPSERIQRATIFGLTRLLLGGHVGDPEEGGGTGPVLSKENQTSVLKRLVGKYAEGGGSQSIAQLLVRFFGLYHQEKTSHQTEIGNALVSIVVDHFDEEKESISRIGGHMAQFLIGCVDKKYHAQTVEHIKYNLENSFDVEIDHRVIQQWLHLI